MNVASLLQSAARSFPDHPALSWRGATLSYRQFDQRTAAFAEWLRGNGAAPEQRVVLYLDNRPELLIAMFGTFRAGSAVVPCNSRLTADELAFLVNDCSARVVVTDPAHAAVAQAAAGPDTIVLVAGENLDEVLQGPTGSLEPADVHPDTTAWIFYTSGTTGFPKGAMLSHAVLSYVTVSWLADLTPLDETDVTLHAAPLSHGAGFHAIAATARAAHQIIPDPVSFDPAGILQLIRDEGVTNTWMVPTQIVMLTEAAPADLHLPTLQYVVYGGAPITPAATTRALHTFGHVFVQLYGQGETPMTATVLRRQDHTPELLGSAGRARPGIDLRIVDPDGVPVESGEAGEIVVRGPSVMSGYWNRPEATAETIIDGWLHTGDLARMTEDGVVFLLDRAKDMIISGGSNIYAVEVEQVLNTHEHVREVAVIGIPDDLWGESVVAVVVPHDAATCDTGAIAAHSRLSLAGYKVPRRYIVTDSLPRNAYGKVLKRELRRMVAEGELA
ncbi:MAG: AMP-binding protein [Actinomycetota bacterium]|nr:AMP-binding protein [Actinomycetota bacterium]